MRRLTLTAALGILAGLVGATSASAGVRSFVATTGSDAASCARSTPCRTFQGAHDKTDPGGEVVAIDSGGFGPVTITKPITLTGARGVSAVIAPNPGIDGIVVAAGAGDDVELQNLNLRGGTVFTQGIVLQQARRVVVDGVNARQFSNGILSTDSDVRLHVTRGSFSRNFSSGLLINPPGGRTRLTIAGVDLVGNDFGGLAVDARSSAVVSATIDDSRIANNDTGIQAIGNGAGSSATVAVDSTTIAEHTLALDVRNTAPGTARVLVGRSTLAYNDSLVSLSDPGSEAFSFGDNTLLDNGGGALPVIPRG